MSKEIKTFKELEKAIKKLSIEYEYTNNMPNHIEFCIRSVLLLVSFYIDSKTYELEIECRTPVKTKDPQKIYNVIKALKECEDE